MLREDPRRASQKKQTLRSPGLDAVYSTNGSLRVTHKGVIISTEQDLLALRSRVHELEDRLKFLYSHLRIEYTDNPDAANAKVLELIKKGNKIEAIKMYREIYNVGLAEAKQAVDGIEAKFL